MAEDKNTTPSPLSPPPFDISQLEEPCVMMEHDHNAWRENTQKGDLNAPYKKLPHIKPRLNRHHALGKFFGVIFLMMRSYLNFGKSDLF